MSERLEDVWIREGVEIYENRWYASVHGKAPQEELERVARLMHAAPELYAAALLEEEAARHWESCTSCTPPHLNGCGVYVNLRRDAEIKRRAGLAKAEVKDE